MDDERQLQVYGGWGKSKRNATQGTLNLVCTVQYTEVPLLPLLVMYLQQLICSQILCATEIYGSLHYGPTMYLHLTFKHFHHQLVYIY